MSLRVGVVADIHYGADSSSVRGSVAPWLLKRALEHVTAHDVDLLVDLGDRLTDEAHGIDRQRLQALAALFSSAPVRREHLLGNHDRLPRSQQETLLGGTTSNRSLVISDWHLVFLDTYDGSIEGSLSSSALDWLKTTLDGTPLPTVVFSHQPLDGQPLIGNQVFEVDYAAYAHPKGHHEARAIMARSGVVRLALSGHAHWNHVVWVDGLPHVTIQSLVAQTSSGDPTGTYAVVDLGERTQRVDVFGEEPFEVQI